MTDRDGSPERHADALVISLESGVSLPPGELAGACLDSLASGDVFVLTGADRSVRRRSIPLICDDRRSDSADRSILVLTAGERPPELEDGFDPPGRFSPGARLVGDVAAYHASLVGGVSPRFWKTVDLLIIDGLDDFVGSLGCHAAMLIRRIRRLCRIHENPDPAFLLLGATMSNASDHAARLVGRTVGGEVHFDSSGGSISVGQGPSRVESASPMDEWPADPRSWSRTLDEGIAEGRTWVVTNPGLCSWMSSHPDQLTEPLPGFVDARSGPVWFDHVLAAAAEHPVTAENGEILGGDPLAALAPFEGRLVDPVEVPVGTIPTVVETPDGEFVDSEEEITVPGLRYRGWEPAEVLVDVARIDRGTYALVNVGRGDPIGVEFDRGQLATLAHPGAVLVTGGHVLRVRDVDKEEREVRVAPESERAVQAGRSTRATIRRHHHLLADARASCSLGTAAVLTLGDLRVSETVERYIFTPTGGRAPRPEDLDEPFVATYDTTGAWLDLDPTVGRDLAKAGVDLDAAVNGLAIALTSWVAWELGGRVLVCPYGSHAVFAGGGLFVHGAGAGGGGRVEAFFDRFAHYTDRILETLPPDVPPRIGGAGLPPVELDAVVRESTWGLRSDGRATLMLAELLRGAPAEGAMKVAGLAEVGRGPVPETVIAPVVEKKRDAVMESGLRVGNAVRHRQWGSGTVARVGDRGRGDRVRVRFDDGTERTILAEYLRKEE